VQRIKSCINGSNCNYSMGCREMECDTRKWMGWGAEGRRKGACASSTLKTERIFLLLPSKQKGASQAARATELPKHPAGCHVRTVPLWCRACCNGSRSLEGFMVALCSNGPLLCYHHLPAAWRGPKKLSKTRKAETQPKPAWKG